MHLATAKAEPAQNGACSGHRRIIPGLLLSAFLRVRDLRGRLFLITFLIVLLIFRLFHGILLLLHEHSQTHQRRVWTDDKHPPRVWRTSESISSPRPLQARPLHTPASVQDMLL